MGLKIKQDNILDQKFEDLAFLPDKKDEKQDLERFLHPEPKKDKSKIKQDK
ncbi:SPJ_0845 family protein [Tetragenococcus koreensis]|uniref:SPJ_0845 family protein n=1 Tax=Tetragenococcus koreensis TaxID=290335 RepID=UPI001194626F|nr:SPJ_0845 family protein [Tetragenococcus koreensis]GEN90971.1 hypothetical protein TKO01_10170 [Tetragenococcus koreensis]